MCVEILKVMKLHLLKQDLMELTHAYCTSIHKSQGSEFPIVIIPIVRQYYRMLQRPILYTGLTRAKQSLVLLGEQEAFDIGLKQMDKYD